MPKVIHILHKDDWDHVNNEAIMLCKKIPRAQLRDTFWSSPQVATCPECILLAMAELESVWGV